MKFMAPDIALLERTACAYFELQPHAALILDHTGHVLRANRAAAWLRENGQFPNFERLTGLAIGGATATGWSRRVQVRAAGGQTRPMELTLVAADGMPGVAQSGLYCALLYDVSTWVQRARDHVETLSRAKASTQAAPVLIWMAAERDRRGEWFSDTWLAFRGRTLGEELAAGWHDGVHPEDLDRCLGIYATCYEDQAPYSLDYRLRRSDGVYRWVLETAIARHRDDGTFLGYIGTCLDITERKALEDRVADYSRRLRLADRRREDFLAKLSHQLRGPLAPIANAAALLGRIERGPPELAQVRAIIERQVEQLRGLVTDLVDVSRVMKGKVVLQREQVDLADLVQDAIDAVRPALVRRRQLVDVAPTSAPRVALVDRHWLVQAFVALLDNASRFSPDGAAIRVATGMRAGDWEFKVEDRGAGIDAGFLASVFDPYTQGEQPKASAEAGLGTGLTVAKKITELHGGDLQVVSAGKGQGCTATLRIPTAAAPPAMAGKDFDLAGVTGQRVLIIEDDPDNRESLRMLMERRGNDVLAAASAEEGLRVAEDFMPQIVVCDVGLPGMDGLGAVQGLRATLTGQGTRYIALTGYAQVEVRDQALDSGFDAVLFKPLLPN